MLPGPPAAPGPAEATLLVALSPEGPVGCTPVLTVEKSAAGSSDPMAEGLVLSMEVTAGAGIMNSGAWPTPLSAGVRPTLTMSTMCWPCVYCGARPETMRTGGPGDWLPEEAGPRASPTACCPPLPADSAMLAEAAACAEGLWKLDTRGCPADGAGAGGCAAAEVPAAAGAGGLEAAARPAGSVASASGRLLPLVQGGCTSQVRLPLSVPSATAPLIMRVRKPLLLFCAASCISPGIGYRGGQYLGFAFMKRRLLYTPTVHM
mmetsp:Transcript_1453/g.3193  ORF Transcript_1453/g.3193 Transcript_1453/m.3193 type:complete len:262 (+) Transcript_1453:2803-3588(+)